MSVQLHKNSYSMCSFGDVSELCVYVLTQYACHPSHFWQNVPLFGVSVLCLTIILAVTAVVPTSPRSALWSLAGMGYFSCKIAPRYAICRQKFKKLRRRKPPSRLPNLSLHLTSVSYVTMETPKHLRHLRPDVFNAQPVPLSLALDVSNIVRDVTVCIICCRKASDQGHPHSSYNVALGHIKGIRTDLLKTGYSSLTLFICETCKLFSLCILIRFTWLDILDLMPWQCCRGTQRQLSYGSPPGISVLGMMNGVVYSQVHVSTDDRDYIYPSLLWSPSSSLSLHMAFQCQLDPFYTHGQSIGVIVAESDCRYLAQL